VTPGTLLGDRFRVEGVLGRGGTATVLLVTDLVRNERVALKVLHPHLADDPVMRDRLVREVRAAAAVRHEGVLSAFDVHTFGGTLALAMPYHPGHTLTEEVAVRGPLPADEVAALAARLADALGAAHRAGVLHRDVTPHNVMVGGPGPALTDFGLARLAASGATTTSTGGAMGTIGYAPPEAYRGGSFDPRSDLYSLGAVLWYAATGAGPFQQPTVAATVEAQLAGRRGSLAALRPDLDPRVVALIDALLQQDPGARPATAGDAARVLTEPAPRARGRQATSARASSGLTLPAGTYTVAVERRGPARGGGAQVAGAVARVARLDPARLEGRANLPKRFRIVRGVDRATADRLAENVEALGHQARVVEDHPSGWWSIAYNYWWIGIPILWMAFPAFAEIGVNPRLLVPFAIGATIALATFGARLTQRFADAKDPLLFARDGVPSPEDEPSTEANAPPTRAAADDPGDRATQALDALEAALAAHHDLPDAARADLTKTIRALRASATTLEDAVRRARSAHAALAPPADAGPVRARLERLVAAGGPAEEQDRLRRALAGIEAAAAARSTLEDQLTLGTAHLLEIGSVAARAHAELVTSGVPTVTTRLMRELEAELTATKQARRDVERAR
jgi:tRNA A-37 threonylcarbamoyl transferase component Bud32